MDIDLAASGLQRIVGSDPPLDTIAHGLKIASTAALQISGGNVRGIAQT
jgi:hypothetical protein